MKYAGRQGSIAFLYMDKVMVNNKIYEMEFLKKNFHVDLETSYRQPDMCRR